MDRKKIFYLSDESGDHYKNLVVFFSRSGNTELMARKIAEMKHAAVIPIQPDRDRRIHRMD